jgi:hypothetical protein
MIWNRIKYFKPTENWGNPKKINGILLLTLDALREDAESLNKKVYFKINCAFKTDGHSRNSQHYVGKTPPILSSVI